MSSGGASSLSARIASLAPWLNKIEVSPELRSRLRWLKLTGIIALLLSPAILSFVGQLASNVGRNRGLEGAAGAFILGGIAVGARISAQKIKRRKEARFERISAQAIQRLILPQVLPVCRGFGLAAVCRTYHEVGGDYYDAIPLSQGQILLAIGDVSGKGIPAALVTSGIHAIMRTQAQESRRLLDVARTLANYLSQHTGRYATMVFGILDVASRRFSYINAGHNPPLLLRENGAFQLLHAGGPPLGLLDTFYNEESVSLIPGDRLLFYTDGLTDRSNRAAENYGEQRLAEALRTCAHTSPSHMTELILRDNDQFAQGAPQNDDICLMVVKCYKV